MKQKKKNFFFFEKQVQSNVFFSVTLNTRCICKKIRLTDPENT